MSDRDYSILLHIKSYCEDIETFINRFGKDINIFINDRAYFNAVSMCILQIGELSTRLTEEYRAQSESRIPWPDIRGMRNIVVHHYGSLDEELVWETAVNDIPVLLAFCREELI